MNTIERIWEDKLKKEMTTIFKLKSMKKKL